jgi:hypothetical protein
MINMESVLQLVKDTTHNVATSSQQTDIINVISKSYRVPNAWHDGSPNVLNAIAANELQTFNWDLVDQDVSFYEKEGLEYALERKMQALRFQGLPANRLEDYLNSIPVLTPERIRTTMELFTVGAQAIMKSDWKPNGGIGIKQTKGYESHRRLCAHEFTTRHNEGRLFVLREYTIIPENMACLHLSPLTFAEKRDKKPRVCHHLSK